MLEHIHRYRFETVNRKWIVFLILKVDIFALEGAEVIRIVYRHFYARTSKTTCIHIIKEF